MRRSDFDRLLESALSTDPHIADLIFSPDRPFQIESEGELRPVQSTPRLDRLTAYQTEKIALNILGDNQRLYGELLDKGSCDCSYQLGESVRFRVNIFRQRGRFGVVMRRTQAVTPTLETLELPPIFKEIAREKNGLILVTGATTSGKSTTLASILEEINRTQPVHVLTLEDPVEFVHDHKLATFTQREFGSDFHSFAEGLRSALRQAPKVILVGEMRDRETVEIALTAAETGHLVLSTLQTINAGQAINRMLGMFDLPEQALLRLRIMETLRWVISQRLVPRIGGGRHLVQEIMGTNLRVRDVIASGEGDGRSYYDVIESSASFGWSTFDQSLVQAVFAGQISEETAHLYASNKNRLMRLLDDARKRAGQDHGVSMDLRLDQRPKGTRTLNDLEPA